MKTKIALVILMILGMFAFVFYKNSKRGVVFVTCTLDSKICPDGSSVSRTGPQCDFDECPTVKESTEAKLGEMIFTGGVYITPEDVVSDSRCPKDVQCVWAGELKVSVVLKSSGVVNPTQKRVELTMGTAYNFNGKTVTLIGSTPDLNSKEKIKKSDYRFQFQVK
ncbi:MAG: hypothetical protein ABL917_00170 [Parcubacteria group bacterium]